MKRLVLFAYYNKNGIVDSYIEYLLDETAKVSSRIIIAINGGDKSLDDILKKYGERFYRENIGYDGGAFKEMICHLNSTGELYDYDEIVLMNDSFYGPFFPWESVFRKMENEEADYWGLTESIDSIHTVPDFAQGDIWHVQGYMLVLKKKIILDSDFVHFWEEMEIPRNYEEAVQFYELNFNKWMQERGYIGSSLIKVNGGDRYIIPQKNVYIDYPYEIVAACGCPILKKKAITILSWSRIVELISYIKNNTDYNTDLIIDNVKRLGNYENNGVIKSIESIVEFCKSKDKIYVYGKGKVGRKLTDSLKALGINSKYVVSELSQYESDTYQIDKVYFSEKDGLIIGTGPALVDEILKTATKYIDKSKIFILWEKA